MSAQAEMHASPTVIERRVEWPDTDEVQRSIIARELLKERFEAS